MVNHFDDLLLLECELALDIPCPSHMAILPTSRSTVLCAGDVRAGVDEIQSTTVSGSIRLESPRHG